jgi:hypothetical protein
MNGKGTAVISPGASVEKVPTPRSSKPKEKEPSRRTGPDEAAVLAKCSIMRVTRQPSGYRTSADVVSILTWLNEIPALGRSLAR